MSRLEAAVLLLSGCLMDPAVDHFDDKSIEVALDMADRIIAADAKRGPVLTPTLPINLLREVGRLHAMGELIAPTDAGHALFRALKDYMATLTPGTVQTPGKQVG